MLRMQNASATHTGKTPVPPGNADATLDHGDANHPLPVIREREG